MDIETFNRDWLRCWTDKSIDGLLSLYHPDIAYFGEGVTNGIKGHAALRAYLEPLFGAIERWDYRPDTVWPIDGGFCGRWTMDMVMGGQAVRMRGLDLCLLRDGLIVHNEIYTHTL